MLNYGDCDEKATEDITNNISVAVADIQELATGKDCPHVKEKYFFTFTYNLNHYDNFY